MRKPWMYLAVALLVGATFTPRASAQKKEVLELQQIVNQLIQAQQALQTSIVQNHAVERTLLEQALDAVNRLAGTMGGLQKTVQDMQANSGARLDSMSTQVQGLSDNVQELLAHMGKLNQQLTDAQTSIQGIDAKLASNAPPLDPSVGLNADPNAPPNSAAGTAAAPAPSADLLYSNGLRDLTGRKYDLAMQEFQDYLKYYSGTDLASNAQFYVGEIYFAQQKYSEAADAYSKVLDEYPKSFKLAPARLKKGLALVALGQKTSGVRELRSVVRMYPGTDEERRARAKLKELGMTA